MSVTTPTSSGAAATTPGAKRPAAITLEASARTRTDAVLFLSRLNGIPGFVEPRLVGGIDESGGDAAATGGSAATSFSFQVEIPVDDAIFGPGAKPKPAAAPSTPSTATQTTQP